MRYGHLLYLQKIEKLIKKKMSDTDDSRTIQSTISTPSSTRKKRTVNIGIRSNKSHTAYFFRIDANNSEITSELVVVPRPTRKFDCVG